MATACGPGCLADASDEAQFAELKTLGELTREAWKSDVQVMIEGPGHIPMDQIKLQVDKEVELCDGRSVLRAWTSGDRHCAGIRPHYERDRRCDDRMAWRRDALLRNTQGAPGAAEREGRQGRGIIAYKIAAHAADVARHRPGARDRDDAISHARYTFDWDKQFALSLDPRDST